MSKKGRLCTCTLYSWVLRRQGITNMSAHARLYAAQAGAGLFSSLGGARCVAAHACTAEACAELPLNCRKPGASPCKTQRPNVGLRHLAHDMELIVSCAGVGTQA